VVHVRRGAHTRARHRREHGDFRRREQALAEPLAVRRLQPARESESRERAPAIQLLGRGFTAFDAEVGAPPAVILSYDLWQREYGGAANVLGRALNLDDVSHVVVGVMPPRWDAFAGGFHPEVLFPQSLARRLRSTVSRSSKSSLDCLRTCRSRRDARARRDTRAHVGRGSTADVWPRNGGHARRWAVAARRRDHNGDVMAPQRRIVNQYD
jgi:hypothetical protein